MSIIFVFGSNLAGRHGAGAAYEAHQRWGAVMGKGVGLHGNSYAIPTKDHQIQTMPVEAIAPYVTAFVEFAARNPEMSFLVTAIGCGLAGHSPDDIAPLFAGATENVFLSEKLVAALR
jgi:hypothetical protein